MKMVAVAATVWNLAVPLVLTMKLGESSSRPVLQTTVPLLLIVNGPGAPTDSTIAVPLESSSAPGRMSSVLVPGTPLITDPSLRITPPSL